MPAHSPDKPAHNPTARSAISNGNRSLPGVDGRSVVARRFRDVLGEIVSDLGGEGAISEGERQLARRAASLSVYAETIEGQMANGEAIDTEDFVRIINALNRTLASIGLRRRTKDIPPDPLAYARARAAESAA